LIGSQSRKELSAICSIIEAQGICEKNQLKAKNQDMKEPGSFQRAFAGIIIGGGIEEG